MKKFFLRIFSRKCLFAQKIPLKQLFQKNKLSIHQYQVKTMSFKILIMIFSIELMKSQINFDISPLNFKIEKKKPKFCKKIIFQKIEPVLKSIFYALEFMTVHKKIG